MKVFMVFDQYGAGFLARGVGTVLRGLRAGAPWLLLSCAAVCSTIHAQAPALNKGFDDEEKRWEEMPVQLPAPPLEANLLPFDVSTTATQQFAVDEKSIAVGSDGVVRYTLVTLSRAGAKNISFEGIRCASGERRIYALGHADGIWAPARRSEWQPIVNNAANRQQAALAQEYFCSNTAVAGDAAAMARRLRRHESLMQDLSR